jgi:hypothetical protein
MPDLVLFCCPQKTLDTRNLAAHFLCQLPVEHSKCWRRIFQFTPGTAPSCHCRFFTVNISDTSGARWYNNKAPCSVSSAGRANGSQPLGRRFEPATEHHDADNSAADARSSCSPGFFFALKQSSRCLCRPAASSCRLPLPAGCLFWPAASSCRQPLPAGCLFLPAASSCRQSPTVGSFFALRVILRREHPRVTIRTCIPYYLLCVRLVHAHKYTECHAFFTFFAADFTIFTSSETILHFLYMVQITDFTGRLYHRFCKTAQERRHI